MKEQFLCKCQKNDEKHLKICFMYLIQKVFMKEMLCGSQSVYSVRQREIPQTRSFEK